MLPLLIIARAGSRTARHGGQLCCPDWSVVQNSVASRLALIPDLQCQSSRRRRLAEIPAVKNQPPNPAVEPTATSRGLRHQVTECSTTPSRWLLPHPARRRSRFGVVRGFSQVAVADFFR